MVLQKIVPGVCSRYSLFSFACTSKNNPLQILTRVLAAATVAALLWGTVGCGGSSAPVQDGNQDTTPPPPVQHLAVATYHNDNARSGINSQETTLTPANVNVVSFGKLASVPVQGLVFAQPLFIDNITMSDGKAHKVAIVATEHDQVYGIDSDTYQVLWQRSLLDTQGSITPIPTDDVNCHVLGDEEGITGTPVIDADSETVYVVGSTKETTQGQAQYFQKIYALNLINGQDKVAPVTVTTPSGSQFGSARFDPLLNLQRAALLLENGNVYVSWASHCDNGAYTGWVMGFSATTLALTSAWTPDPSGLAGGMWMSGEGPLSDSNGNLFLAVGNGWSDPSTGGSNYGDSVVRLTASGREISVADYFMPYDYDKMYSDDLDLGAGGPILLPSQTGARFPDLLVTGGKDGTVYLLNRSNLGQWHANDDSQVVQSFQVPNIGCFSTPLFWNNTLYYGFGSDPLQAYAFDTSSETFNTTPISSSSMQMSWPGVTPSMSNNNGSDAILWVFEAAGNLGILRAFDPSDLSSELYDSELSPDRDRTDGSVRFAVPTVAAGKVFVGSQNALDIYGVLGQ